MDESEGRESDVANDGGTCIYMTLEGSEIGTTLVGGADLIRGVLVSSTLVRGALVSGPGVASSSFVREDLVSVMLVRRLEFESGPCSEVGVGVAMDVAIADRTCDVKLILTPELD